MEACGGKGETLPVSIGNLQTILGTHKKRSEGKLEGVGVGSGEEPCNGKLGGEKDLSKAWKERQRNRDTKKRRELS